MSEGLLLLTNDGDPCRAAHPPAARCSSAHTRRALAGTPDEDALTRLRKWTAIAHNQRLSSSCHREAQRDDDAGVLLMTIREGRNRQVRRPYVRSGRPPCLDIEADAGAPE